MKKYIQASLLLCTLWSALTQAGVTIGLTRVIYHGNDKEASVPVINGDKEPYLIQSWAQSISTDGTIGDAPFMVTPPLFRLNAGQKNVLRVIRTGGNLPEDRESIFWLDIKSIPSSNPDSKGSKIKLAVKTEFKLIYRPQGLTQTPEKVTSQLKWTRKGEILTVNNPTPYYMNFADIIVGSKKLTAPQYVAPFSSSNYKVPTNINGTVSWSIINDYGGAGPIHKQSQ
ncbi:fimbria/pilus periplasmic chaperone [Klebsiella sp. MISC125]|uniref:fimbria/pilus periplasmic chaperone n=1 Tax=Klebsiella sp. MISC125 TaxID=2755386 RepID=UPI003DA8C84F